MRNTHEIADPVVRAHGGQVPDPLTLERVWTSWEFSPVLVTLLAVPAGLYLVGVWRLRRNGVHWSRWRTASWFIGLLLILLAASSVLDVYDTTLFSVHAVQHLFLQMLAPVPLALAAPITLALRALPLTGRRRLTRLLHSSIVSFLSRPLIAYVLFVTGPFLLYYTPLFEATLRNDWIHNLSHLHFVLVGCMLFWAIVGVDPIPHRLPPFARFALVLGMGPMHVLLGIPIMTGDSLFAADYYNSLDRDWGLSPLEEQQRGGALLWVFGDIAVAAFLLPLLWQWYQSDQRESRRMDRHLDRLGDEGGGEPWWTQTTSTKRPHAVRRDPDNGPGRPD